MIIALGHGEALVPRGSLRRWRRRLTRAKRRGHFTRVRDVRGGEVWLAPDGWIVLRS